MPGVVPACGGLPVDLPAGRPRIRQVPATRMAVRTIDADSPDTVAATYAALVGATQAGDRAMPATRSGEKLRRRRLADDRCGSRLLLGIAVADGEPGSLCGSPDQRITVHTWEYGVVGAIVHPGWAEVEHSFAALRRYVREQGYGIVPGTDEQVFLSDPSELSTLSDLGQPGDRAAGPMLLLLRLWRFY